MNTRIPSSLAVFAAALMMNGLIIAGVNSLFNSQMHQRAAGITPTQANGAASNGKAAFSHVKRYTREVLSARLFSDDSRD
jgi:hypothetical protein